MKIKNLISCALCGLTLFACSPSGGEKDAEMDCFITDLMERMTLREKLGQLNLPSGGDLVTGSVMNGELSDMIRKQEIGGFFNVKGIQKINALQHLAVEESRLKIPLLVGADVIHGYETIFPIPLALSCSWDTLAVERMARISAIEASADGINWTFSPMVDICRDARWGRIAEGNGEDPYLGSLMAKAYVRGYQGNNMQGNDEILACVKHFALNNQENDRHNIDVTISDRALHEIYLPAFEAAIKKGGAWAIMGSYNKMRNVHCCHNSWLLNKTLKQDWGFDGVVISDWGGTYDTHQAALNGLDMEFGTWVNNKAEGRSDTYNQYFLADPFLKAIKSGEIEEKVVDEKVRRILRMIFRTSMNQNRPWGSFSTPEHSMTARSIAEEGIVLLKNDHKILPLNPEKINKILVVGENATRRMTKGGGSSSLKVKYETSPLEGIIKRFGPDKVTYLSGYHSKEEKTESLKELSEAAQKADAVIFIGGLNKEKHQDCEGVDRDTFSLPYGQDEIISTLSKTNSKTIVLILSGNAVAMPWINQVNAVMEGWYCGSEAGDALAAVISGDVNPSGKLPFTFPVSLKDNGAIALGEYPGKDGKETYQEDIFVGYRWTDKKNIKPLFSFGHGLSYTTFEYGKVRTNKNSIETGQTITLTVSLKNTGSCDGSEVVQLYLGQVDSPIERAVKELKGFQKVFLKKGETKDVSFTIEKESLRYWDETSSDWKVLSGKYEAFVAASSTDIRSKFLFMVN